MQKPITFNGTQKLSLTEHFLERLKEVFHSGELDKYGKMGVEALSEYTPKDTGETADSWDYEVVHDRYGSSIYWTNSNIVDGVNIALILQYGHATKNGYWVEGIDYINPALQPVFEEIAEDAWREVTNI